MSERSVVQDPLLKYANEIGWTRLSRSEAMQMRGGDTGRYFSDVLQAQLLKLNKGIVDDIQLRRHSATVRICSTDA